MTIIDIGSGPAIVLIPGVQGRWEWMRPTVDALARRCRVITFSLADEPTCGAQFDAATGFACYVRQVGDALDAAGLERATICGVSYGGLIAAAFAAEHPERTAALILVSALPPTWSPDARARFYLRAPRLLAPLFCAASLRLYREIAAASDGRAAAIRLSLSHLITVLRHMFSPARMARRITMLSAVNVTNRVRHIERPTMVITGDPALDRVVPVRLTLEYVRLIPHAQTATLARTGHIGLITRSEAFADLLLEWMTGGGGPTDSAVTEALRANQRAARLGRSNNVPGKPFTAASAAIRKERKVV
jgi:3-oxoadipate enol-lactonase